MIMKQEFLPAPKSIPEAMEFAKTLASSQLVPKSFQQHPNDIFVAMLWSHNLGIPVIQGLQYIAVVNGRPTMYGDGALAVVMASGLMEDIKEEVITTQDGKLTAVCTVKRKNRPTPIVRTFSQQEAMNAFLWGKQGPWKAYPKRMLQMRARAFALRDGFPDVLSGMGIYEEQQDVEAEAAEVSAPTAEPVKPTRKMPRKKAAAAPKIAHDPSPTIEEVTGKSAAEILEPVKEAVHVEAVESVDTVEAIEDIPIDEPIAAVEVVENDGSTLDYWTEKVNQAANYAELLEIWKTIPTEERSEELVHIFSERRIQVTQPEG